MRGLVFSIDDAYVMPFKVLWHSLMKTDSVPDEVPVFILHAETLSPDSIQNVTKFLRQYERAATFRDARSFVPDDVPLSHHISKATYYRLFVASVLPEKVSSAVYLDSDMVVTESIIELFSLKLTSLIAAVDHFSYEDAIRLHGDTGGSYFQAGLIIIDVKGWRDNDIESKFLTILKTQKEKIRWWDQDVLNIFFSDRWQRLPFWYNYARCMRLNLKLTDDQVKNVRLIHFDGAYKPWRYFFKEWHFDVFYKAYYEAIGEKYDQSRLLRDPKKNKKLLIRILKKMLSSKR